MAVSCVIVCTVTVKSKFSVLCKGLVHVIVCTIAVRGSDSCDSVHC